MKNLRKSILLQDVSNITNSSGLIKVTTAAAHGLTTGNKVEIVGVLGTTEANNKAENPRWTITTVGGDPNSFTLDGSAYANVYTSGTGKIYKPYALAVKLSATPTGSDPHVIVMVSFREVVEGAVVDADTYELKKTASAAEVVLYGTSYSSFIIMDITFRSKCTNADLVCTVQVQRYSDTLEPLTVTIDAEERASFAGGSSLSIYDSTGALRSGGGAIDPP